MARIIRWALCALLVLAPASASARRRPPPPPPPAAGAGDAAAPAEQQAPGLVAPPVGYGAAVGSGAARLRVAPDPGVDTAAFRAALQATQPQLVQCMVTSELAGTLRVTARVAMSHALDLDIQAPNHDAAVTQCAELALRRALTAIAAQPLTRPLRSTLAVRRRRPAPARVPRPARPVTADVASFEGPVHASIERDRSALISCLSSASPGMVGNATLRLTLARDGSLTLSSASLPTGVPAGPALPCIAARVAQMRFSPAPSRSITIEHTISLDLY